LPISLHSLADPRTLDVRYAVTSHRASLKRSALKRIQCKQTAMGLLLEHERDKITGIADDEVRVCQVGPLRMHR
jgi:hypothetical protein